MQRRNILKNGQQRKPFAAELCAEPPGRRLTSALCRTIELKIKSEKLKMTEWANF
jgi:hypothetical protein